MKTIFTLLLAIPAFVGLRAQAILNEVYAFPGGSRNEFYEFFNNGNAPVSMDNYTIVTYFEEGAKKGFFVVDVPNLTVAPRGFFVGSSAIPFNYQGVSNATTSQYSWNNLAFMAANSAYLRRWELANNIPAAIDGNANYDLATIPANYNDIFQKIGGGGATYNVFVYKNGVLLSIFLGGTGGATFIPDYIVTLPTLHIDMAGAAPDFNINFSTYGTARTEYVIQDIGSDNGYIRLRDGYCGTWTKSSSQVNHTPGITNGGDATIPDPTVSVQSAVVRGNAVSGSTYNYDVVGADAMEFPVTLYVYLDNGSVEGELDVNDVLIDTKVENTLTDGPFSTIFFPYDENILIQTVTSAGCIDNLRFIPNTGVLPVKFTGFQAFANTNGTELKWYVAENEWSKKYEVEQSADGRNFQTTATVLPSEKTGNEMYHFKNTAASSKIFYRIKLIDNSNKVSYSNTLAVGNNAQTSGMLSITQNPVESYLNFQVNAAQNTQATINIYNASGVKVHTQNTTLAIGRNSVTVNVDGRMYTGVYVLEVKSSFGQSTVKFMKR